MQKQFPLFVFVLIDSLVVAAPQDASGFVAMRFPAKITSSCFWLTYLLMELFYIGMPVMLTDGRVYYLGFDWSGWVDYHIFLGMGLRSRALSVWSSATNLKNLDKPNKLASINQNVLLIKDLRISVWYL